MHLLAALGAVEEVLLNIVANSEESAAGRVRSGVDTVGARNPAGECACTSHKSATRVQDDLAEDGDRTVGDLESSKNRDDGREGLECHCKCLNEGEETTA